jgi:23S rRNA (cytidine1920-2'-O)/16S rRNA (cytidine1409-2'-O)-methyltransferase
MKAERPGRQRLDQLLLARGLAPTRAKAQALILAGRVTSDGRRLEKPGTAYPIDLPIEVSEGRRYVSRGGHKLEGAVRELGLTVADRDVLDVGASTGGFTDLLLKSGARRVIALDVGRGQLDWTLRNDPRVHPVEGCNARYLAAEQLPYRPSLAVIDVSFISLELILPPVVACLDPEGDVIALIKPQFEVGRGSVGRGGIVRDPDLHGQVLDRICGFIAGRGWAVRALVSSPLRGADGNREFFVHFRPGGEGLTGGSLEQEMRRTLEPEDQEEGR